MPEFANYPDILGLITGGSRLNVGVAQCAVAVRPRLVRAGRAFEVILLVQNAADCAIDVSMALHLPAADAKRQPDRFVTKTERLVVSVKGAEVGYVVLPVTTLPDTAVSDGYKIGVEIDIKPLSKPSRIRSSDGGSVVDATCLNDQVRTAIEALQTLSFSTAKRMGRAVVDVPLTVMSGTVGKIIDFTPGWVSVCKLADYGDDRLLLHHYGSLVQINTLPRLKRAALYPPLLEATHQRFAEAGYPLKAGEAVAIAKLMTLILEYATPRFNAHGSFAARGLDVESMLTRDPFTFEQPPVFPHWFRAFLSTIEVDERVASHPVQVIPRHLYLDLLRDAVDLAFDLVSAETGEDLGSPIEREQYREQLAAALDHKTGLDFSRLYLPLVLGGLLVNDQFSIAKENPADLLRDIGMALEARFAERVEANRAVYDMTTTIIAQAGQRYGFYLGG